MVVRWCKIYLFFLGYMSIFGTHDNVLRIMTYNIRRKGPEKKEEHAWENRRTLVGTILDAVKPDIIGFQEATEEQIADLQKMLPAFTWFGKGRGVSWFGLGKDEYTPLFYNRARLTLLKKGTFSINQRITGFWYPWRVSETGILPRICTWGKFKDKKTHKQFYVFNTHLDHKYENARIKNLEAIKKMMKGIDPRLQEPIFLMGDFNTELTADVKKILPDFYGAKERAQRVSGPRTTRTGWDDKQLKDIDHILINKSYSGTIATYVVIDTAGLPHPSDHRPVFADIEL